MFHIAAMITPTWQRATAGPDSPRGLFNMQIHLKILRKDYHYDDVIMSSMASQITSLTIIYSTVYSGPDQRKHQSSASLAFVRGIHRVPVNSPHKWPVTRKMFPFDDVIMIAKICTYGTNMNCISSKPQTFHVRSYLSGHTWPFLCIPSEHTTQ